MIVGQDKAVDQFAAAWTSRKLHHAWLLAGARGVGKATFAQAAARRMLAEAAGPPFDLPGLQTSDEHPIVKLVEAGSHPDMRRLERLVNEKTGNLARNINVDQVRELGEFLGLTAALSDWRVVIIDTVDELEASGANALLKILEEPPPNSIFLLVSHAPGRLLPTIRSRCRRLDFQPLNDDAMTSILEAHASKLSHVERERIITMSAGSAGRALAFAELDLAKLEDSAVAILRQGDPTNARRSSLATELGKKAAADRYAAFLDLAPTLIAREARQLDGAKRERALDAYAKARELAVLAPRLSLDAAATVFQIGGILAEVAQPASLKP
ncbi:DNA polymerase III subunit delta' [Sphingomonas hankyongi]|uniref:DNA polymerase III subunit delta n=1 Tax=Sphingomonas hankyongi TaxID=2908209 RepID=A0ABT0S3N9_9SPHN|nr:DNA polymerase III subunit delta' [Sphingomonas hankyongi]MCL6730480.1 DNA polymerase III subunit delta' [Sphingomonas hankyongi]